MPSLPDHPDLDQVRRQAKELRDATRRGETGAVQRFARHHRSGDPGTAGLAAAQLVIARELGFVNWPALKAGIIAGAAARDRLSAFLTASIEGRIHQARDLLRADPGLATRRLAAACALGDADVVTTMLAADPAAAVSVDEERGWPPLLYLCYSRWHQAEPDRAASMADTARMLLSAGAHPNTNDGGRPQLRAALTGSIEANNPTVAAVLLDAGANPDLGQPIGVAAGQNDHRCLELLLAHGARVARTWALDAAVLADDPVAVSMLLVALGSAAAQAATDALLEAVVTAGLPVINALLDAGADPRATDSEGMSALRNAVRAGRPDTAARLWARGAVEDSTDVDRFVGACLTGDRATAGELLACQPDLADRLSDADRVVIVAAAGTSTEAVALMLDLGFSPHDRNDLGEQPLHTAAYHGNADTVRLLLAAGADVDAHDAQFDATPLAFATVGSGEQAGERGDWITTVRLLLEAGASRHAVWIAGKPPSAEVIELLGQYGIAPNEPVPDHHVGATGSGVLADLARHLDTAYRERDLDLLGSLLHPQVRWTGYCTNRAQVLDWYRDGHTAGAIAVVHTVEVVGDAIVLELSVAGPAEGARPGGSQHRYQVFTVHDGLIVEIRGYADRPSARARG